MAQAAPFWRPDQTWADLVDRYGTPQRDEVSRPGRTEAPVPVVPTEVVREAVPGRDRRLAELRRALVLAEVLGPPRAMRGVRR
jgi:hypothetical protein